MRSRLARVLILACLPLAFAACGDDDDDGSGSDGPQVFEVELTDDGVTAPESASAGAIEIRATNAGKQDHGVQVVVLGDGHSAAEVKKAGEAWGDKGRALPEWLSFAGGVGNLRAGTEGAAVVNLPPGEYAAFDIEGRGEKPYAEFTVEGDEGELPETDATVEAAEYSFEAAGLTAGTQRVLFDNAGEEPHHLIAAPLRPGKTVKDVKAFMKSEKGEPPIDEKNTVDTAILSGGESELVELDLKSGDYALMCFIPDRAGGPPHAFKGMISAASVE
jgi:hypothetical protein